MADDVPSIEERLEALEEAVNNPCADGHAFQQCDGHYEHLLFCPKCGAKIDMGEHKRTVKGFAE